MLPLGIGACVVNYDKELIERLRRAIEQMAEGDEQTSVIFHNNKLWWAEWTDQGWVIDSTPALLVA